MKKAGSAGIGVADFLRAAMRKDGISDKEARSHFWVVDQDGLLHSGRTDLTAEQRVYTTSYPSLLVQLLPPLTSETDTWEDEHEQKNRESARRFQWNYFAQRRTGR